MKSDRTNEPIAIVGIGCRFPGARNPFEYWKLLKEGKDAIDKIPSDRWNVDALFDPDSETPGKMISKWGGFLQDIDSFDWKAFRILPRELSHMDPQHRLLLEVSYEALEDAGMPLEEIAGSRTGVFVGVMWNDYHRLLTNDLNDLNGYTTTGNAVAFAPNRISYTFDFRGPSIAMDCACASSLASVHAACQSIRSGESDMALAGGVNLILSPDVVIMLSKAGLLSPEGKCKTLDATADGFVLGEGAGIIVLKPLSKVTESDHVYALIRGSALNHNGRNEWIMAVNHEGQKTVISDAIRNAGVKATDIDYVELHGTALPKGDALEVNALQDAIGSGAGMTRKSSCALGSVKSNIGHLESAAGIAGVIKVALSMHNNQIPATLHINNLNPNINLQKEFVVQQSTGPWPSRERPNLAGVTAIALTGSNAHVILEGVEPNPQISGAASSEPAAGLNLFLLSAFNKDSLNKNVQSYIDFLSDSAQNDISVKDMCYTLGARRSHHKQRLAILAEDRLSLIENLQKFLQNLQSAAIFTNTISSHDETVLDTDLSTRILQLKKGYENNNIIHLQANAETQDDLMLKALAVLYTEEYKIDWKSLYQGRYRTLPLPQYQWHRERFWLEKENKKETAEVHKEEKEPARPEVNSTNGKSELLVKIEKVPANRREEIIADYMRNVILQILGLDQHYALGLNDRLFDAGLDSIGVVELTNRLRSELKVTFSSTTVFNYPTIASLSSYLVKVLAVQHSNSGKDDGTDNSAAGKQKRADKSIAELSEQEAEELLILKIREAEKGVDHE